MDFFSGILLPLDLWSQGAGLLWCGWSRYWQISAVCAKTTGRIHCMDGEVCLCQSVDLYLFTNYVKPCKWFCFEIVLHEPCVQLRQLRCNDVKFLFKYFYLWNHIMGHYYLSDSMIFQNSPIGAFQKDLWSWRGLLHRWGKQMMPLIWFFVFAANAAEGRNQSLPVKQNIYQMLAFISWFWTHFIPKALNKVLWLHLYIYEFLNNMYLAHWKIYRSKLNVSLVKKMYSSSFSSYFIKLVILFHEIGETSFVILRSQKFCRKGSQLPSSPW